MKFGIRTPSLKKRIAARTSLKRVVRHNLGLKAPRGWGWLTNPKRAAYNRVYNRTTVGCGTIMMIVLLLMAVGFAFARGGADHSGGTVHVNGYFRSNGTYVQPHTRTAPDGIKSNNLSYHSDPTTPHTLNSVPDSVPRAGKADNYYDNNGILRDSKTGHIHRSETSRNHFKAINPCPSTGRSEGACPGYVIDHIIPLKRGGKDDPSNMQWQTIQDAKAKDRVE